VPGCPVLVLSHAPDKAHSMEMDQHAGTNFFKKGEKTVEHFLTARNKCPAIILNLIL
jgi:hypothetical protein